MSFNYIRHQLVRLWSDERGISAMEYGFLAAMIAIGLIAVLATIGSSVANLLEIPPNVLESPK
ncbi:MAG: Flp family type IVb pilin [Pseudomonadota bacterium]